MTSAVHGVAAGREGRTAAPIAGDADTSHPRQVPAPTTDQQLIETLDATLDAVASICRQYVAYPSQHEPVAIALWTVHTYLTHQVETSPFLAVTSAEKRSGKTRQLDVLELLVARPWRVILPSEAVLFRKMEKDKPTLLLDETDTIFNQKASNYEALRGLLNAGNRRGTRVPRMVGEGRRMTLEEFDVFGAKVLAGIGHLPDTISDRAIPIRLVRRAPSEAVERFRIREASDSASGIRASLEHHAAEMDISEARPEIPDELDDRSADGWEPLLAIADHAGADWPAVARRAAVYLSGNRSVEDDSIGVLALSDIREIFATRGSMRLTSEDLVAGLLELEESPWGEYRGGLTKRGLARLLRPYGIQPAQHRFGGRGAKGYLRSDCVDAWERYLPSRELPDPPEEPNDQQELFEEAS